MPIRIPTSQGEPEPDLVWALRTVPSDKPPQPQDVLLLVEVAETSLLYDRTVKLSTYAEANIPEYWIVNLIDEQIEVYRNPSSRTYQAHSIYQGDAEVHPLALPTANLQPSRIFV